MYVMQQSHAVQIIQALQLTQLGQYMYGVTYEGAC